MGELFLRYAPLFELYRQYSFNQQQGLRLLREQFPQFVKRCVVAVQLIPV